MIASAAISKVKISLYRKTSSQIVILRCIGPQGFFLEKVVFPFEDRLFRSPPESRVDIWCHGSTGGATAGHHTDRRLEGVSCR